MIARLFDPIDWLAPAIITAKVFMQNLWRLKCEWDDTLPDEYTNRWTHYYVQLESLSEIRIPRWIYLSKENSIIQIHGFIDASTKAYAAVLYLRIVIYGEVKIVGWNSVELIC